MNKPTQRRIGFLGFDGVQALDIVGPADAFGSDAFLSLNLGASVITPYEIVVLGLGTKTFPTSTGLVMRADTVANRKVRLDTLIIPGGAGLRRPGVAERAAEWISSIEHPIRRVASVCTGLYGLAPTGKAMRSNNRMKLSRCSGVASLRSAPSGARRP